MLLLLPIWIQLHLLCQRRRLLLLPLLQLGENRVRKSGDVSLDVGPLTTPPPCPRSSAWTARAPRPESGAI